MRQERHAGYEVKALSNLIRRKVWELSGQPECDAFTEMQGMLLGFLCHNRDQEIFQKDLEEAFYIRRSTASRLLKRLEEEGFVMRCSVSRDARLKQVMATPKAEALNQQIASRITQVEAALTKGIGAEELQQFMMTIAKMKQNLMEPSVLPAGAPAAKIVRMLTVSKRINPQGGMCMKKKRGLVSCIQEFKKDTILTPIFVIGEVAFDVLIPMMTGRLLTQGVEAGNMERIFYYGGIVVLMALAALLLGALSGRYAARAATGFSRNLRREMYQNVQKFSFSNIDKFSTGGIITRLTTDVTNVQMAFMMIIRIAVRCPIMLICAWVLTFTINPRLALVFLVVIPILGLGLFFIMTGAHPIFERVFKRYDHLNNVVQENLLGIRVVKSFVREEHEKEKFGKVSQEIYMDFSKAEKLIAFNMPLMQLCVYACILTVSWLSAHLVVGGSMDVGQLTSMFSYIMMILMSLMMLSMVLVMIILARASAERITELLNEESDLRNGENPVEEVKDGSVVFENVSFSYAKDPSKECLKNVNLNIKSGETVGILGGTGTSKTTLVQLIPRLYDATEGRILVGGVDVRDYDMDALREQVAMVLQKNVLFSGTIKENLRWGKKDATDEEMVRVCKLAQADPFIQEFPDKYDTYIEQGGSNVSGGQKQRLCIARALLKKPKILILDDSTSAVDTKTDALIRKAFREEIPDTTKFIIAQRISSIEDADKILVMDGGRISAMGTHGELLQSCEIYREIYESQTKGGSEDE